MGIPKRTHAILATAGALIGLTALLATRSPAAAPSQPVPAPTPAPSPPLSVTSGPTGLSVVSLDAQLSTSHLLLGSDGRPYLSILVNGANQAPAKQRAPLNLALVIDRSGSMAGTKIVHARRAAQGLIDRLDDRDRVALIDFGTDVHLLAPSTPATAGERARLKDLIERLEVQGGTNISGGLEAGLAQIERYLAPGTISRVILMSDGEANEGIVTAQGLSELASRLAARDVTLSTIGLGLEYNENVMTRMAEHGGGQYYYVKDGEGLARVFSEELDLAATTVAQDVSLRIEPAPGVRIEEVLGYPHVVDGRGNADITLREVAARQTRRVLVALRVPSMALGAREVAQVELRYVDALDAKRSSWQAQPRVMRSSLGITVVATAAEADRGRNAQVMARVAEVELARTVNETVERYGQGDVAGAQALFDRKLREFEVKNQGVMAAAPALRARLSQVRVGVRAGFAARPSSPAGQDYIKAQKGAAFNATR